MNICNKLTISRIILTFVFMFFLFVNGIPAKVVALFIFLLACLSDYLDGFLARKHNTVSNFGIIMDPIADKILVLGSFLAFVQMQLIPAWMVIIVLFRELVITGIRIFALSRRKVLKAELAGKHKTMSQMFTIFIILLFLIFKESAQRSGLWSASIESISSSLIFILMSLTVILTATSGISYLWENRSLFSKDNL